MAETEAEIRRTATRCRKSIIGSDSGLLGRLILENKLGAVCAVRPDALSQMIADAVRNMPGFDPQRQKAFAEKSSPLNFSQIILDAVAYES